MAGSRRMTFGTCHPRSVRVVSAHMKTPTIRQQLLRARRSLLMLGLAGVLGLEVFAFFDLQHPDASLEMPLFYVTCGLFVAFGALISNALRCPKCAVHISRCYKTRVGRDFHSCTNCGADFNAPPPRH